MDCLQLRNSPGWSHNGGVCGLHKAVFFAHSCIFLHTAIFFLHTAVFFCTQWYWPNFWFNWRPAGLQCWFFWRRERDCSSLPKKQKRFTMLATSPLFEFATQYIFSTVVLAVYYRDKCIWLYRVENTSSCMCAKVYVVPVPPEGRELFCATF